ncbi:hypothetical protein BP6252_01016 [Coleophoma cylindrospora]|uniref:N-acetyltransferase domain-containing protein n=1 Tax=Coleophoma cylindrospora TaxID=1849047 RepID=A0A3D8SRX9_9HELO|nr:hypothetical protein BP6252_01016 [Coleophoma cylindrospora]
MEPSEKPFTIVPATTPEQLDTIRALFQAYAISLGFSLAFQDFTSELASLPGDYGPPGGLLYLAVSRTTGAAIGCLGLRPLKGKSNHATPVGAGEEGDRGTKKKIAEMKRLYCTPEARGLGVGAALVDLVLEGARELGYEECWLDTLPTMGSARGLYLKRGFSEIEKYYDTPLEGTIFLGKKLA